MKSLGALQIAALVVLLITAEACTLEAAPQPTLNPVLVTLLAEPTATPTPAPSATPLPTPTAPALPSAPAEEKTGFGVWVSVDSLNLRSGPGLMFDIVGQELLGTRCVALGRVGGDDWLQVRVPDGSVGYMLTELLELSAPLTDLPQIPIPGAYVVAGRVVDSAGEGIEEVTVAIYQGAGADELRTEATTNIRGIFTAYLPLDSAYTWTASVVGVGCGSRIADTNCNVAGSFGAAATARFDLPLNRQLILQYSD